MSAEKQSSSYFKVLAFFDLVMKLVGVAALWAIFAMLMQLNSNLTEAISDGIKIRIPSTLQISIPDTLVITPSTQGLWGVQPSGRNGDPIYIKSSA